METQQLTANNFGGFAENASNNPYNLKPAELSSGTTIMAVMSGEGGVIIGSDTRMTTGSYVVNRFSDKIAQVADNIFCARCGSAADTQVLTEHIRYYLQSMSIETGRPPLVKVAAHLMKRVIYENKDNISGSIIVAGWDALEGAQVYNIAQGGTCTKVPFALGGSGSTYIYGLIDSQFRPDLTNEQARNLVKQCLSHAMARDGGSGGMVRTILITPEGHDRDDILGNQLPFGPVGY